MPLNVCFVLREMCQGYVFLFLWSFFVHVLMISYGFPCYGAEHWNTVRFCIKHSLTLLLCFSSYAEVLLGLNNDIVTCLLCFPSLSLHPSRFCPLLLSSTSRRSRSVSTFFICFFPVGLVVHHGRRIIPSVDRTSRPRPHCSPL